MVSRRTFLETGALAAGGAAVSHLAAGAAEPLMVGIQVGAVSFVDEGTERVVEALQQMGAVNTLFVATFTYGRGIAGRQPRPNPLPDHGKQQYDDDYRGGVFFTAHPELYRKTSIAPEKAPDHPGYDVLADVLPVAHRRGVKVIAWFESAGTCRGWTRPWRSTSTGSPVRSSASAIPTRASSGWRSWRTTCARTESSTA